MSYNLSVTVTEPTKHNDSFGSFVSYKVNTSTNRPAFSYGQFSVVRRYSDFVWLQEQLGVSHPGIIIPAIPEKQAVGRFSPDFIETRRRALEKFLTRVGSHPVLVDAQHFITFLTADDTAFTIAKVQIKEEKKEKAGGGTDGSSVLSWFNGTVKSAVSVVTGSSATAASNTDKSAADLKIEDIIQYLNQLETHMQNVAKGSAQVVRRSREMANALFEFGQAFTWLGQSEGDSLGAALTQVGTAADQLSVASTEFAEEESCKLEEPVQEYVRLIIGVKSAIKRRQDLKANYIAAIAELEARTESHRKAKDEAVQSKLQKVEQQQQVVDKLKDDLEQVTEQLLVEFDRFKADKAADIQEILLNFAKLQIEYHRKTEKVWADILPQLQSISVATPSSGQQPSSLNKQASNSNPFPASDSAVAYQTPSAPPVSTSDDTWPPKQQGIASGSDFQETEENVGV